MPSKDHRVAARHAKLRQRQKKHSKSPSHIPSTVSTPGNEESHISAPATIPPPIQRSVRREQSSPATAVNAYVKGEIKRILLLSGAVIVVLIAAGFALT